MEARGKDRAGSQVRNRPFSNASSGIGNASVNEDQLLALSPVRSSFCPRYTVVLVVSRVRLLPSRSFTPVEERDLCGTGLRDEKEA